MFTIRRSFRYLFFALGLAAGPCARAEAVQPVALSAAVENRALTVEGSGNGRDQLILTLHNPTAQPVDIQIAAGQTASGATADSRVIVLRSAVAAIPAHGATEVSLPVAALSSKNAATPQPFTLSAESAPKLTPLLKGLADQPDAPRATAQLAVLAVQENLNFAEARAFFCADSSSAPTPAEVTQAIDALGLLRIAAPEQTFALASDADLKARALRNPWCRVKAMALYGLDLGDGAAPPDLRQLLHTQPGDNCPICRQRALLQKPTNDL